MAEEVELKLDLTPEAAAAINSSSIVTNTPRIANQRSIYFDTANSALKEAGLSLRIRQSDGQRIQTVKAASGGSLGLFVRSEWEQPIDDDIPNLDAVEPVRAVIGDRAEQIAPLFEVLVERRTWIVHEAGATIEMALDHGEVVAADRRSPLCELELELVEGDPKGLFALARKLDAVAPLRLGVLSKSERGYRLTGPAARAFKSEPVGLTGDMTAAHAFQQIVQACLRHFRLNEAILLHVPEPDALHQARVALRRLRSAFSIFKPMLGEQGCPLRETLRWLAAELGEARNLDVLIGRGLAAPIHDRLIVARETAYRQVTEALASPRARKLMLDLSEWTTDGDWLKTSEGQALRDQPAQEFACQALDHFRRRVKKAGRDIIQAKDAERHEVRKDAKKLRYAAEFFSSLYVSRREKRRYKRFVTTLEALQDELGGLNDLATASIVLETLGVDAGRDFATRLDDKAHLLHAAAAARDDLTEAKRFWR